MLNKIYNTLYTLSERLVVAVFIFALRGYPIDKRDNFLYHWYLRGDYTTPTVVVDFLRVLVGGDAHITILQDNGKTKDIFLHDYKSIYKLYKFCKGV